MQHNEFNIFKLIAAVLITLFTIAFMTMIRVPGAGAAAPEPYTCPAGSYAIGDGQCKKEPSGCPFYEQTEPKGCTPPPDIKCNADWSKCEYVGMPSVKAVTPSKKKVAQSSTSTRKTANTPRNAKNTAIERAVNPQRTVDAKKIQRAESVMQANKIVDREYDEMLANDDASEVAEIKRTADGIKNLVNAYIAIIVSGLGSVVGIAALMFKP